MSVSCSFRFFHNFKINILSRKCLAFYRLCNTDVSKQKKLEDYFFDQRIQSILKKITGLDYEKVFAPRQQKIVPYKYEFVTDKQLKEMRDAADKRACEKLQMPPVMSIREPCEEFLAKDPELQGYLESKLVFIDTSESTSSRNRVITVREIDGTLRTANWDERFKMNQIFFPIEGRSLETPKFFESPYFDKLLNEESYIFILDAACAQFEPDDPEYHRVTHMTYEHIKERKKFDVLRSTRHFGPMAFYFATVKNIDAVLVDMIERQLISDAADCIKLLFIMNPELEFPHSNKDDIGIVQEYIQRKEPSQKADLELVLQTYLEVQANAKEKMASV